MNLYRRLFRNGMSRCRRSRQAPASSAGAGFFNHWNSSESESSCLWKKSAGVFSSRCRAGRLSIPKTGPCPSNNLCTLQGDEGKSHMKCIFITCSITRTAFLSKSETSHSRLISGPQSNSVGRCSNLTIPRAGNT